MAIEQACIRCQNCARNIVLPRQSHLGAFDGQISPSKEIWPINFFCLPCGLVSVIPPQTIHLEEFEMQDQYQLVRYDFSSAQPGCFGHVAIYTREVALEVLSNSKEYVSEQEAINHVLLPSRLWRDSYGHQINFGIDRGCRADPPMWVYAPIEQPPAKPDR